MCRREYQNGWVHEPEICESTLASSLLGTKWERLCARSGPKDRANLNEPWKHWFRKSPPFNPAGWQTTRTQNPANLQLCHHALLTQGLDIWARDKGKVSPCQWDPLVSQSWKHLIFMIPRQQEHRILQTYNCAITLFWLKALTFEPGTKVKWVHANGIRWFHKAGNIWFSWSTFWIKKWWSIAFRRTTRKHAGNRNIETALLEMRSN